MQKKSKKTVLFWCLLVLTAAWTAFIFCRSAQPAVSSKEESGRLLTFLQQFFPWLTVFLIRKAAHMAEFFILGVLLCGTVCASGRFLAWIPTLAGLTVAVSDELIQLTQDGRSCELRDMAIDFSGVLLAVILFWLTVRICTKKRSTRKQNTESR